jgi:hypothetical protein
LGASGSACVTAIAGVNQMKTSIGRMNLIGTIRDVMSIPIYVKRTSMRIQSAINNPMTMW